MNWRKYHRVVSLIIFLPLAMITLSGVVLQLRNQFESLQPKSVSAEMISTGTYQTFESIIAAHGNEQIDQIILRPAKKNLAVRLKDGMEIQLNPQTGEVLKKAPRRTNFLIDLHQGTWLGSIGQYYLYLPTALGLIFLLVSGLVIYPFKKRRAV